MIKENEALYSEEYEGVLGLRAEAGLSRPSGGAVIRRKQD